MHNLFSFLRWNRGESNGIYLLKNIMERWVLSIHKYSTCRFAERSCPSSYTIESSEISKMICTYSNTDIFWNTNTTDIHFNAKGTTIDKRGKTILTPSVNWVSKTWYISVTLDDSFMVWGRTTSTLAAILIQRTSNSWGQILFFEVEIGFTGWLIFVECEDERFHLWKIKRENFLFFTSHVTRISRSHYLLYPKCNFIYGLLFVFLFGGIYSIH